MIRVVLPELDREGRVLRLPRRQAAALAKSRFVEVRPEHSGAWRILPAGRVGAARVGDLEIQITPKDKVGLDRLLFLLGYARDPGFRPEDVTAAAEPDLWPALAETLARLADRATGAGVLQGYITVEDAQRTVRGRIRIGDQISLRPGMMLPIEVTYDDYTVDIPENRILRSAIRRMLAVPRLPADSAARLAHVDARLDGVHLLRPRDPLPQWTAERRNRHYQPALRLSEIILANTAAEAGPGGQRLAAFAVDMAKVFEDFLGTALTEALRRRPGSTRLQHRDHLDQAAPGQPPGIILRADIVHTLLGRPRLVFDAKYKAAGPDDNYPNADHYQMLAYCTALDLATGWLVYAGPGKPRTRYIRNTAIDVVEYPLDLSRSPQELLAAVDALAAWAWSSAEAQRSRLDAGLVVSR